MDNLAKTDPLLAKYAEVWLPLTEHLQAVADHYISDDECLTIQFYRDQSRIYMDAGIQKKDPDLDWMSGPSLRFYTGPSDKPLVNFLIRRHTLGDIFRRSVNNPYAMVSLEADRTFRDATIHPDRMDEAKKLFTGWLASVRPAKPFKIIVIPNLPETDRNP